MAKATEINKCQSQGLNPGLSEAEAHVFNQNALAPPQWVVLAHNPFQRWKEHPHIGGVYALRAIDPEDSAIGSQTRGVDRTPS